MYEKPKLERFGNFRELTRFWNEFAIWGRSQGRSNNNETTS